MKKLVFDVQMFTNITKTSTVSTSGDYVVAPPNANTKVTLTINAASVNASVADSVTAATTFKLNGSRKDKTLDNRSTITGGQAADVITNSGAQNSKIYGGAGNDVITSSGEGSTIYGDEGNDKITINTTTEKIYGLPQIYYGHNSSVNGGEGNDTISVVGGATGVSIDGGAGTNTIYVGDGANVVVYNVSDGGSNVINGYNDNTTIKVVGTNSISSKKVSGSDFILGFDGDNSFVTIKGATAYESLNIALGDSTIATVAPSEDAYAWTVNDDGAHYGNSAGDLFVITGLSSDMNNETIADNVTVNGTVVTLNSLALGADTASVQSSGKTTYTLALADDVRLVEDVTSNTWKIRQKSGTAEYHTATKTNGYVLAKDAKSVSYQNASDAYILIKGLGDSVTADNLSYDAGDNVVTVSVGALGASDVIITSDNDTKLALVEEGEGAVPAVESLSAAGWVVGGGVASYKSKGNSAGYTLSEDGTSIAYTAQSGYKTSYELTGVSEGAEAGDFVVNTKGKTITVAANALGEGTVTETTGTFALKIATDVAKPTTYVARWAYDSGSAEYHLPETTSAGYTASGKTIVYHPVSDQAPVIVLSGLKESVAKGVSLNAKTNTVTLTKDAVDLTRLGDTSIQMTKGSDTYKLALGTGLTVSKTTSGVMTIKGTTANYKGTNTTKGYYVDGNTIKYTDAKDSGSVNITGLKKGVNAKGLSVSNEVITLSKAALGTTDVKIDNTDYSLAVENDVAEPEITKAAWSVEGGKAAYWTQSNTAGYTVSKDEQTVTYTAAVKTTNPVTVTGLNSKATAAKFTMNETAKTVAITSGIADTSGLKISGTGYAFTLTGKVATAMTNTTANTTITGGTANDTLTGGAKFNDYLVGGAGNDVITGLGGNNSLVGDAGNDNITGGAGNDSMIGGDGNDTLTAGAGNDFLNAGKGNDVLKGEAGNDTLMGSEGTNTLDGGAGNDYIYGVGQLIGDAGNDTLVGGATASTLDGGAGNDSMIGGSAAESLGGGAGNDTILAGAGADKIDGGAGNDYADGGAGNDTLAGGDGNDTLIGGTDGNDVLNGEVGNDLLWGGQGSNVLNGGVGNDTLVAWEGTSTMTGGAGNDVFVCSVIDASAAVITDYNNVKNDADTISIASTNLITNATLGSDKAGSYIDFTLKDGDVTSTIKIRDYSESVKISFVTDDKTNLSLTANDWYNKYNTTADANVAEMWFAEEDNFATAANLDSITKADSVSIGEVVEDNSKYERTKEAILAFAGK